MSDANDNIDLFAKSSNFSNLYNIYLCYKFSSIYFSRATRDRCGDYLDFFRCFAVSPVQSAPCSLPRDAHAPRMREAAARNLALKAVN